MRGAETHLEVRRRLSKEDLPDQFPARVPDLDAVATPRVYVPVRITVDA